MRIITIRQQDEKRINQAAALLVAEFKETGSTSWPGMKEALAEVSEAIQENHICLAAVDDNYDVLGWIGGIKEYDGNAWELHPLVVKHEYQRRGIGIALVRALEAEVRAVGGITIYLGTDDENSRTSIGGADLYPNVLEKLTAITNLGGHPFGFYLKAGFAIVGVIPDANGYGKPDILMAKRV